MFDLSIVAPFVGVWIEILELISLIELIPVAPFVGVWIEIMHKKQLQKVEKGRSLRGSVD